MSAENSTTEYFITKIQLQEIANLKYGPTYK